MAQEIADVLREWNNILKSLYVVSDYSVCLTLYMYMYLLYMFEHIILHVQVHCTVN